MNLMKEGGSEQPMNEVEREKESLRRLISHYPAEAGMPGIERMAEYALRLGEDISVRVNAMQRNNEWYVNLPDGTTSRVATFKENLPENPPRDLYIVYSSNATVSVGHGKFGVEFRMESVDSLRPDDTKDTPEEIE